MGLRQGKPSASGQYSHGWQAVQCRKSVATSFPYPNKSSTAVVCKAATAVSYKEVPEGISLRASGSAISKLIVLFKNLSRVRWTALMTLGPAFVTVYNRMIPAVMVS